MSKTTFHSFNDNLIELAVVRGGLVDCRCRKNKLFFIDTTNDKVHAYDISNDTWNNNVFCTSNILKTVSNLRYGKFFIDSSDISTNSFNISRNDTDIASQQSLFKTKSGSTTTTIIGMSTQNALEIGSEKTIKQS